MSKNSSSSISAETWALVDQMLDGTLTDEGVVRLEGALAGNPAAQKEFAAYCQLHVNLHADVRARRVVDGFADRMSALASSAPSTPAPAAVQPGDDAQEPTRQAPPIIAHFEAPADPLDAPPTPGGIGGIFGGSLGMFALGALVAGIAAAAVWQPWREPARFGRGELAQRPHGAFGEPGMHDQIAPAAYLTSTTGGIWAGDSARFRTVGSSVRIGEEVALLEGIAEFRLSSGVYLSLEGPSGLVLTSPNSLVLQYGKVTCHVPWSADGYFVTAGATRFAAADAEFGICLTGGRVDAHVFTGEVEAKNSLVSRQDAHVDEGIDAEGSNTFTEAVVPQGQSVVLLNQNGIVKASKLRPAVPSLFATKLSMAGGLPISKSYVDAVLASRPLAYWRLESVRDGMLANEMGPERPLQLIGNVQLVGSHENHVAEFRPDADCYLTHAEPLDALADSDYSFEVWLKPSHTHCSGVLSLCAIDPETSKDLCGFLLELESSSKQPVRSIYSVDYPNSIRFLHRSPPGRSSKVGTSCFSNAPYDVRRWQHVVAVKRSDLMQLYVDGKLSATARDDLPLASGLRLIVGRQETVGSSLQFIGQLDEIAVYPRALTSDEVKAHYKAVDWNEEAAEQGSEQVVEG